MPNRSFRAPTGAHKAITEKIVALIEAGAPKFTMPWHVPPALG